MEPETRKKIEDMVLEILKQADIEETTEFSIRVAASERLGIDLSYPERKQLVRTVVESYLLAAAEDKLEKPPGFNVLEQSREAVKPPESNVLEESREVVKPKKKELKEDSERVICQLSKRRNVVVGNFKGTTLVSLREYYLKDGKQLPGPKGISLSTEQWSNFKKGMPAIEEAITKMEGNIRSDLHGKQNGDVSNSVVDVAPLELVPIEVIRFDGKNYQFWAQQMELLLKQLKIEYVLTEPCPNSTLGDNASTEEIARAKAAEKRWVNDDLMCHRNILSHLSDHLYNQYVNRKMSAKELWEELRLVYMFDDFGTKRSQVRKYIEFQIVNEKAIIDQIHVFNSIADAVVAAGMFIDENFHVSVIISKLPQSWKDFCIKLTREEYLSLWKLMDYIRMEEEYRNGVRRMSEASNCTGFNHANKGGPRWPDDKPPGMHRTERIRLQEESHNGVKRVREPSSSIGFHHANKGGPRWTDDKPPGMHRNRSEINGKSIPCYICGRKGHLAKNCWGRFDKQGNERKAEENVCTPSEVNMMGVTD